MSKVGARDRAIEQCMRIFNNKEVTVVPRHRRWKNQHLPDFVLVDGRGQRDFIPPFFGPPEGVTDFEKDRISRHQSKTYKRNQPDRSNGNSNVHHLGPPSSGISLENFVIMLKGEENPVCILNTSAQFCKMGLDFFFEKSTSGGDAFVCTLYVEGEPVADGKGQKKSVKNIVAEKALKCLSKICHSVLLSNDEKRNQEQGRHNLG